MPLSQSAERYSFLCCPWTEKKESLPLTGNRQKRYHGESLSCSEAGSVSRRGIIASGLAELIANSFTLLAVLPLIVIILLICLFITFLNEVVSNTAMASIMVPLMAITSISMGINPMMLMVPAALASSLGFMLPVGTPPNAITYGTGYISTREMARAGFALNIIGCILITLFMTFIIPSALGISPELPAWAVIPGK